MLEATGKTYSEKKWNEDVFYISDSCIFVIDGATGLANNQVMSEDDAYWFAHRMKEEIVKRLHYPSLFKVMEEAVLTIQNEYKLDISTMDKSAMPSACLSLFREKDQKIEYFGLGDCVGIIEFKDGNTETLYDEMIENLDGIALDQMKKISQDKNIPFLETRKYVNPILLENRKLRNVQGGYYALDLTLDCMKGVIYRKYDLEKVRRIACMSDGFYQILSFNEQWSIEDLFENLKNMDTCFLKLYKQQKNDPDCQKVCRLKIRDDTTVVVAGISL